MDFVDLTTEQANALFQPLQTKSINAVQECTQQVYLNVYAEPSVVNEAISLCFTLPYAQVLQALGL